MTTDNNNQSSASELAYLPEKIKIQCPGCDVYAGQLHHPNCQHQDKTKKVDGK